MSGWQTMDSAPKDGTAVIVWNGFFTGEAYFLEDETGGDWFWANTHPNDFDGGVDVRPPATHWQPFPAPPEGEKP